MIILGSILSLLTIYNLIFFVGLIYCTIEGYRFLKLFWYEINFPEKNLLKRYGENTYAVITGGTDGIGKNVAIGFAKRGFNIILIARNELRLKSAEKEIKEVNSKIQTKIIVADFNESYKDGFFHKIMSQIDGLDVSVLVNCAGTIHNNYLAKQTVDQVKEQIVVNCIPQAVLTRNFVQKFKKREKKSAIISFSSLAGVYPTPIWSTYSATKAFIDQMSLTVSMEYPNLDVLAMRPSYVRTKLTAENSNEFLAVNPDQCAHALFKRLGYVRATYGHWQHIIVGEGCLFVPTFMRVAFSNWLIKGNIRREGGKYTP